MPRHTGRFATLLLATLAGAALGVVVALVLAPTSLALFEARTPWTGPAPAPADWPAPPHAGESAEVIATPAGRTLRVLAPRLPQARHLAESLAARRAAGLPELAATRAALAHTWTARVLPGPLPPFAPEAECASLLLADAARRRDAAAALPAPYAAAPAAPPAAGAGVPEAERALAAATLAADPAATQAALVALAGAEDRWLAAGVPTPAAPPASRGATWRAVQFARADSLDSLAARSLAAQTPLQRELAVAGAAERVLVLARSLADPYAPLAAHVAPVTVTAGPLAGPWAALVGFGGGLGALAAFAAAWLGFALRPRGREAAPVPARDPALAGTWLHVVAGAQPEAATRAALELAAHALARRERVLLVDASARVRLHERLGRESRWGLLECLQGDMPVLGLVQYAGRPGFYLLARGHAAGTQAWAALGRCLDDARLHFGRIVLLVDRGSPRELGDALAGRALEGWWAAPPGRLPAATAELSGRLGIAFSGMDLSAFSEVSLEALSARVAELAVALPVELEPAPEPVVAAGEDPEFGPLAEPVVLDCDLQVRQRLRFLAWMRRVQSESRRPEASTAPR